MPLGFPVGVLELSQLILAQPQSCRWWRAFIGERSWKPYDLLSTRPGTSEWIVDRMTPISKITASANPINCLQIGLIISSCKSGPVVASPRSDGRGESVTASEDTLHHSILQQYTDLDIRMFSTIGFRGQLFFFDLSLTAEWESGCLHRYTKTFITVQVPLWEYQFCDPICFLVVVFTDLCNLRTSGVHSRSAGHLGKVGGYH